MHRFYVVGNLKMNLLSREEVTQYLTIFRREANFKKYEYVTGIIAPPFLYSAEFDNLPKSIKKGAQNMFPEKSGSYTGEISPLMLKNDGVEYIILGHSERRMYAGETDAIIHEKLLSTLKYYMIPIVCIGETRDERETGKTEAVIIQQIRTLFSELSKLQAEKVIVAYEPRWAIGTDTVPTTNEIIEVRLIIRNVLAEMFDVQTAEKIALLYGGSVKSSLLSEVTFLTEMNGVLVGRESLFPYEIVKMMNLCEEEATRRLKKNN